MKQQAQNKIYVVSSLLTLVMLGSHVECFHRLRFHRKSWYKRTFWRFLCLKLRVWTWKSTEIHLNQIPLAWHGWVTNSDQIKTRFSLALVISQVILSRSGQCDSKPSSRHGWWDLEEKGDELVVDSWATGQHWPEQATVWTNTVNTETVCVQCAGPRTGSVSQNSIEIFKLCKSRGASYSTFTDKTKDLESSPAFVFSELWALAVTRHHLSVKAEY